MRTFDAPFPVFSQSVFNFCQHFRGNFCLTFSKTISGYLCQITPIDMQLPVRMTPRKLCTVFPRFGAPGRLLIFKVYGGALNKAGPLTRMGVLTKTCYNVRLAVFRIVTNIKIF